MTECICAVCAHCIVTGFCLSVMECCTSSYQLGCCTACWLMMKENSSLKLWGKLRLRRRWVCTVVNPSYIDVDQTIVNTNEASEWECDHYIYRIQCHRVLNTPTLCIVCVHKVTWLERQLFDDHFQTCYSTQTSYQQASIWRSLPFQERSCPCVHIECRA